MTVTTRWLYDARATREPYRQSYLPALASSLGAALRKPGRPHAPDDREANGSSKRSGKRVLGDDTKNLP